MDDPEICLYSGCEDEAVVQGMWCEGHWPEVQASVAGVTPPEPAPIDRVAPQEQFDTEALTNALAQSRSQISILKAQYHLAKAGVPAGTEGHPKQGHPGTVLKELRKAEKTEAVLRGCLTDGLASPSPVLDAVADIEAPPPVAEGPPGGGDVA